MEKQDKIKAIYEKIADKTLSFWCIVYWTYDYENELEILPLARKCFYSYKWIYWDEIVPIDKNIYIIEDNWEDNWEDTILREIDYEYFSNNLEKLDWTLQWIIGHPVMINRIEFILNENDYIIIRKSISKSELLLPIENWNEKSIDLLYKISLTLNNKTI